jgi:uncharacterized protein (DUF2249 family)
MTAASNVHINGTSTDPAARAGVDLPSLAADLYALLHGGTLNEPDVLDVRPIPQSQRRPRILGRYARPAPGESVPVNNHDPKPLRRELTATHPGGFTWDYPESGPDRWCVRIGRTATSGYRVPSRPAHRPICPTTVDGQEESPA